MTESQLNATARWTAAVRARETLREDRLINDPWAEALAGKEGLDWFSQRPEGAAVPILIRTRYFDDFLQSTLLNQEIHQVVLMAAGLDTRAFRLDWPPGTVIYELDQAPVLEYKEKVLHTARAISNCERRCISTDLTTTWQDSLLKAGFAPAQPSLWLLEGFLFYIPSLDIARLLEEVSALTSPGSWLGFDIINGAMLNSPITRPWIEMQAQAGAPWIGILDDPQTFLAGLGWKASLTQAGQPDASYGRWTMPILPTHMPNMPHNWFVTARKE